MLTVAITEDIVGRIVTVGEVWARTRRRIWPLLGLSVTITCCEFLGLIPCLVLGVWLWGIWAVAVPAFMVEGTTVRGSLRPLAAARRRHVLAGLGHPRARRDHGVVRRQPDRGAVRDRRPPARAAGSSGTAGSGLPIGLIVLTAIGVDPVRDADRAA